MEKKWDEGLWPQCPPLQGKGTQVKPAFLHGWETPRWTVAALSCQGNGQTGPHPGSKGQAGRLKQADKGRTIPDLKNDRNYLPRGGSSGPLQSVMLRSQA